MAQASTRKKSGKSDDTSAKDGAEVTPTSSKQKPQVDADGRSEDLGDITWAEGRYIAFSGLCMGTADVVPGVSGGTMAVALGIYARLLAAIASVSPRAIKALLTLRLREAFSMIHWRFILCLMAGVGTALVVMVKIVKLPQLLTTHQSLVYAVFFGLVAASAVVLGRRLAWTVPRGLLLAAGVGLGYFVVTRVPVDTPTHPAFIFFAGFIAISAMLLPGISGSFILLIMRKYAYILQGLSDFKLSVIVPFALGCLLGLVSFSRVVSWMMKRWHDAVVAFLTGLLLGSLYRIWPYQSVETVIVRGKERPLSATPFWPESLEISVVLLCALGFFAVVGIELVARRRTVPAG